MPYIGVSPFNGVRRKHTYTATASQTSFSGAGTEGATLSYTDSTFVDVFQNGVKLGEADYTATSGTAIVLAQGASLNDLVEVVVYDVFSVADTVSKSAGGTFDGNVTMGGTLGVTGNATVGGTLGVTGNATVGGTLGVTGVLTGTSLDISGNIDVDGITNLDVVDIDGAVNMSTLLTAVGGITSAGTYVGTAAGSASAPNFAVTSGALGANGIFVPAANTLAFSNAGTERLRIDSGARLAFGNTDTNAKITVSQDGSALNIMRLQNTNGGHSCTYIQFANSGNNSSGNITQTGSNTVAYNTSSDYRLKENVSYNFDATTRLKQLKPARFNFIENADTTVDGFLAHEVSSIVPEAISGTKDATRDIGIIKNEDGDITAENAPQAQANTDENETWEKTGTENVYQGIDQSKLVPLLVKTIQELEARIAALESA